ncbi:MAG: hypothetical protein ACRD96_04770, partial [Bryobacteraceae bacterium]
MTETRLTTIAGALVAAALTATTANAQALPFSLRVQQPTGASVLPDGGTFSFAADAVGRVSEATLVVTYRGTGTAVLTFAEISGSNDFVFFGPPEFNLTVLQPNQAINFTIRFAPSSSARVSGGLRFGYTDTPPPPVPPAQAQQPRIGTFSLGYTGVAPEFVFTVVPQPTGS